MTGSDKFFLTRFFRLESASGLMLMGAAVLALIVANIPFLSDYYEVLINTPVAVKAGALEIHKPLLLWVNDGLMAVFFLLIGLELKREFIEGELSSAKKIMLPGIGAVGGMAVPALIYIFLNSGDPVALKGWAIPAATDIAFALGILALLGSDVPTGLKVFLSSLAIFDDLGAILIIAFFYTSKISVSALIVGACCVLILFLFNLKGIVSKRLFLFIGIIMWIALLKSGVHATLAGVILAMFVPLRTADKSIPSSLRSMEQDLHAAVAFIILPVFAFCNAGIVLKGTGIDDIFHNVPLGIALGLFLGKQLGVFAFCWIAIRLGLAELPGKVSWASLYGTSALCGIGFTMSLFIGSLAFEETGVNLLFDERLGIILGSVASGILGFFILRKSLKHLKDA